LYIKNLFPIFSIEKLLPDEQSHQNLFVFHDISLKTPSPRNHADDVTRTTVVDQKSRLSIDNNTTAVNNNGRKTGHKRQKAKKSTLHQEYVQMTDILPQV